MTTAISPPIFVAEGNDLAVFETVERAERQVESPDVDDYKVFDSEGLRLRFLRRTEPTGRWIKSVAIEPVQLVPAEESPSREELRALLLRCLVGVGETRSELESLPLGKLISRASERFAVL